VGEYKSAGRTARLISRWVWVCRAVVKGRAYPAVGSVSPWLE